MISTVLASVLVSLDPSAGAAAPTTIDELVACVERERAKFSTFDVAYDMKCVRKAPDSCSAEWFHVWIDGPRVRVDEAARWPESMGSPLRITRTVWDGSAMDHFNSFGAGVLSVNCPREMSDYLSVEASVFFDALGWSPGNDAKVEHRGGMQTIDRWRRQGATLRPAMVDVEGARCHAVDIVSPVSGQLVSTWFVDPSCGWMTILEQHYRGGAPADEVVIARRGGRTCGTPLSVMRPLTIFDELRANSLLTVGIETKVTAIAQLAPGVFIPAAGWRGVGEAWLPEVPGGSRMEMQVRRKSDGSLAASLGPVDPGVFKLTEFVPPGTVVWDAASGREYREGG